MRLTKEIPQRAFINAQIVQEAQRTGNWAEAINSICALYELTGCEYMNQAHVASLLYCLLIVPKEIWIGKDKAHSALNKIDENLDFTFWNEFAGKITFRCKITTAKLMLFLSEVGAVLANLRRKT